MVTQAPLNLIWMRRDLRLHDHSALSAACMAEGNLQPIFVFDSEVLARFANKQDRRLSFLMATVQDLHKKLVARGGGLIVLYGKASEVMPQAAKTLKAAKIFAARDHEAEPRARDRSVFEACETFDCKMIAVDDNFLQPFQAKRLLNKVGEPYKVFTPFARHWRAQLPEGAFDENLVEDENRYASYEANKSALQSAGLTILNPQESHCNLLKQIGYEAVDYAPWNIDAGAQHLKRFVKESITDYRDRRNLVADNKGTSHLSPYLRFGLISVRECARAAVEKEGLEGLWLSELIWRDFYAMTLYHTPEIASQEFHAKYRTMQWNQSDEEFERWQQGQTGYPVVDAAMRQLLEIGWIHNRARMIVASFLTKHLLIDWRRGEEHFAQHLMDYELSSNVGGWQWSASVGVDPQPYFRIFNPITNGQKFDPKGQYISRYVPELAKCELKKIHEPWKFGGAKGYPDMIIDHKQARERALDAFKNHQS